MSKSEVRVRVVRNVYGKADQPWHVTCTEATGKGGFASMLGYGVLGWAADWAKAQDYATSHASYHRRTNCKCCGTPVDCKQAEARARWKSCPRCGRPSEIPTGPGEVPQWTRDLCPECDTALYEETREPNTEWPDRLARTEAETNGSAG